MNSDEATDVVALAVFRAAQATGQPVTLTLTLSVIAELETHRDGCCAACSVIEQVKAERVSAVARTWQLSVQATRRRAYR
jgi:hypothetical protein